MTTPESVRRVRERGGYAWLDRALLDITGPKRAQLAHNLLSNDILSLQPGQTRLAALMNIKGHQIAWMRVLCEETRLVCEVDAGLRDTVEAQFVHYRVGAPVRFAKREARVLALFGGAARARCDDAALSPAGALMAAPDLPAGGGVVHVEPSDSIAVEARLQREFGDPVSRGAIDTLRVEEGIPWHGVDVREENLLHETGQLQVYHSSTKGCYLGQEVVARLEGRGGNVNKRLRGLRLSHPVEPGTPVSAVRDASDAPTGPAGRVTTSGDSPEFGFIALAMLHRSLAEPGTRVLAGNAEGEVAETPFRARA